MALGYMWNVSRFMMAGRSMSVDGRNRKSLSAVFPRNPFVTDFVILLRTLTVMAQIHPSFVAKKWTKAILYP